MCSKSKIATPARNDSYADDTRAPLMQPAPRGATHDKLTSTGPFCNGLSAFATRFCFCLSPASNGSNVPRRLVSSICSFQTPQRRNRPSSLARLVCAAGGGIAGGGLIELAVKRRAADLEPACDFGHLPAIMRDREPDDLGFHFFERPHFSGAGQHREHPRGRQRRNRYLITRYHGRHGRMERRPNDQRLGMLMRVRRRRRLRGG